MEPGLTLSRLNTIIKGTLFGQGSMGETEALRQIRLVSLIDVTICGSQYVTM